MSAGKGDTPRPKSVNAEEFARRWAKAFATTDALEILDRRDPSNQCPYCGCLSSRDCGWARECLRCDRKFADRR